jgi:hypothetical protein
MPPFFPDPYPNEVEQATRRAIEAETEYKEVKKKFEEVKKEHEEARRRKMEARLILEQVKAMAGEDY